MLDLELHVLVLLQAAEASGVGRGVVGDHVGGAVLGAMKPKPFSGLNHLTTPVVMTSTCFFGANHRAPRSAGWPCAVSVLPAWQKAPPPGRPDAPPLWPVPVPPGLGSWCPGWAAGCTAGAGSPAGSRVLRAGAAGEQ